MAWHRIRCAPPHSRAEGLYLNSPASGCVSLPLVGRTPAPDTQLSSRGAVFQLSCRRYDRGVECVEWGGAGDGGGGGRMRVGF